MVVRIYALAKELRLDSKILVDICVKAGVTGKGSALASLTDEEVERIKSYLGGARAAKPMVKPPVVAPSGPVPTLPPSKPAPPSQPAPVAPVAPLTPPVTPLTPPVQPAPPSEIQPPVQTAFRREDYMAPAATSGKPPVLGARSLRPLSEGRRKPPVGETAKAAPRTGPAIKLAPMPTAKQPPPETKAQEPAPQKPDIKLPIDAIRASKAGGKPLEEHLRKHEQKRKAAAAKARPERGAAGERAPAVGPEEAAARERGRRGKGAAVPKDLVAKDAEPKEAEAGGALGGREQRQLNRKRTATDARKRKRPEDEERTGTPRRYTPKLKRTGTNTAAPRKTNVALELPCSVRTFSEAIGVPVAHVLGKLLSLGTVANINTELDAEAAELLAVEMGVQIDFKRTVDLEQVLAATEVELEDPSLLEPRPPIVTFLGHVDHGKTSLLDKIIGIDVVSSESGGITQHIRAYQVEREGRRIAFVDTPGHEAFTQMRARGANVTDIAVLVVAADDGVMPQTEEAISHARAAGVPIVVALNKIDLPGVNMPRILQQLSTSGLLPTEWGGDTEVVQCSALKGTGIDNLLETLLTIAELNDYRANPNRPAIGTCLESELQEDRGVVAKLLVQKGTLKVGDVVVCGMAYGRVKAMYDTLQPRKTYREVGPSMPVNVTGLSLAPGAGDHFHVLDDITQARELAEKRAAERRQVSLGGTAAHVTLETLFDHLGGEKVRMLNLIVRADVRGSIEAIQKELGKLAHPEVQLKILQATVGGISEADVHLADASDAVIIGFNVVPDEGARSLAERQGVQIRRYEIIYKLTEDLRAALEGMLKPEKREKELGRALVQRTFHISRIGTIAGCRVIAGIIQRNCRVRLIRDNRIVGDYPLESLRREKDDAREVREGLECGMKVAGFDDLKEGDILEAYKIEEVARTF
ncbi:MAG: translation initiation factor IF-2 [Pirellulales bacterium]